MKRRAGSKRRGRAGRDIPEVRRPSRARELARNLALLVATLLLFGLVAEVALRVMVGTESNWFGDTAATDEYYLRVRRNSWGFRDVEHDQAKREGVTRIAMVGDSFVFGVPIEDDEKIFPRLLQKKLGERYELISVAFPERTPPRRTQAIDGAIALVDPSPGAGGRCLAALEIMP